MDISVVIPSYNRIGFIETAIKSILNQTVYPLEIIVVDDGSNDGTYQLIEKRYPSIRLFKQSNKGVSSARNLGIKKSRGDWIAFLDSDDEWLPDKLRYQINSIEKNPNILFFHSDEIWIRNGLRINQGKKHKKYGGWIFEKCLDICRISPSSVIMHKSIFKKIGFFDENIPICEDYDLWLRVTSQYEVFYIDKILIKKYGGHAGQLSTAPNGIEHYRAYAIEKLLRKGFLNNSGGYEVAKNMLIKKLKIYKMGLLKRGKIKKASEIFQKIEFWK